MGFVPLIEEYEGLRYPVHTPDSKSIEVRTSESHDAMTTTSTTIPYLQTELQSDTDLKDKNLDTTEFFQNNVLTTIYNELTFWGERNFYRNIMICIFLVFVMIIIICILLKKYSNRKKNKKQNNNTQRLQI